MADAPDLTSVELEDFVEGVSNVLAILARELFEGKPRQKDAAIEALTEIARAETGYLGEASRIVLRTLTI